jgi:hypothetical protein
MIIGVVAVQVMQVPVMDKVGVRAVLDAHMLFARMAVPVLIGGHMGGKLVGLGIGRADLDRVLVNMPVMGVVEVTVVQIVDMAGMFERLMAAAFAMGMAVMAGMQHLMRHGRSGKEGKRQNGENKGSVHFVCSTSDDPAPHIHVTPFLVMQILSASVR